VEVQLSSTAAGITARLVADSPEAARMLAQAGEELRRSLEDRDVRLISLEITTTAGDDRRDSAFAGRAGEQFGRGAAADQADADAEAAATAAQPSPDTVHSVLELSGGLLVDVLA
jgi:hypothetical protein